MSSAVTQEATTRATADGYLGSRYTLSVSTSGGGITSVAGMEIASTSLAGRQATNHIAFFADRFYITHSASGVAEAPFKVEGGRVYIKSAVIQEASIDTLKIQGNAVTVPVVVNSSGNTPVASIYLDQPGHVLAIGTVNFLATGSGATGLYANINGQGEVGISVHDADSGAIATCYGFALGAGLHTFKINVSYPPNKFKLGNCSLVLMGAKR